MNANETDARIGRMVKVILDLEGIDQRELAARIGMKPPTLGNKINGTRPWKASEVEAVAVALGVPTHVFQRDPADVIAGLTAA